MHLSALAATAIAHAVGPWGACLPRIQWPPPGVAAAFYRDDHGVWSADRPLYVQIELVSVWAPPRPPPPRPPVVHSRYRSATATPSRPLALCPKLADWLCTFEALAVGVEWQLRASLQCQTLADKKACPPVTGLGAPALWVR
jgi:hypothetical protein